MITESAFASSSGELTETDILQQVPMVASATRLSQPVADAPVAITIIDRELIEASGAIEIPDVLRLVPGMQIGLTWRDHHTGFTYHGQSDGLSRRMQVLVDGRVALSSQFGLTDWDRLAIQVQDIERIEVVRGSAVASYGSHAFIGAINIVTRDIALQPTWQATSVLGSNSLKAVNLRYSHSSENFEQQLNIGQYQTDSFNNVNDHVQAPFIRWAGSYQLDEYSKVDWQTGYGGGFGGRGGGSEGFPLVEPVGDIDLSESYAVFRWNKAASADNQWYLQLSYNNSMVDDRTSHGPLSGLYSGGLPVGVVDEEVFSGILDLRADRTDVEFQQTLVMNDNRRLVWGAGGRLNRMKGFLTLRGNGYFNDTSGRLFGNLEQRAGNWLFNAGLIIESGDLLSTEASHRLGANYRLNDHHTLRVSYAKGVRQPFVAEAFHELGLKTASGRLVEPLLLSPEVPEAERINSYSLGLISEWDSIKMDIKLFHDHLSNEIIETYDPLFPGDLSIVLPGSIIRINAGSTRIGGAEMGLDVRPWQGGRLWVAYSYASTEQRSPPSAFRSLQTHSATPRHTASLSLSQQMADGWDASVNYYYLDKMQWLFLGQPLDSYDRLDMRVAKDFVIGDSNAKLELIGQNLLGSDYNEFSLRNNFGSRAFIRFSIQLD